MSNIVQVDGADCSIDSSQVSSDTQSDINDVTHDTEDEVEPDNTPIELTPVTKPNRRTLKISQASSLPLVTVLNARSL